MGDGEKIYDCNQLLPQF